MGPEQVTLFSLVDKLCQDTLPIRILPHQLWHIATKHILVLPANGEHFPVGFYSRQSSDCTLLVLMAVHSQGVRVAGKGEESPKKEKAGLPMTTLSRIKTIPLFPLKSACLLNSPRLYVTQSVIPLSGDRRW